jgi:hypothetical protein
MLKLTSTHTNGQPHDKMPAWSVQASLPTTQRSQIADMKSPAVALELLIKAIA